MIDHLAKPNIKMGPSKSWKKDLLAAASFPNVACKLSGMVTEADWATWKPSDLRPYVETVLEAFGSKRCLFGSDWPVCELAGSYQEVFAALEDCIGGVTETERADILGQNAVRIYGLQVD